MATTRVYIPKSRQQWQQETQNINRYARFVANRLTLQLPSPHKSLMIMGAHYHSVSTSDSGTSLTRCAVKYSYEQATLTRLPLSPSSAIIV